MAGLTAEEQKKLNELLKKQVEMQAEGYGLSTSYLESLKEILGIKSRVSTADQNLVDLNKKINREIMNQKAGSSDINELQKQIKNNQDLLNRAKVLETDLSKILTEAEKKRLEWSNTNIETINKKLKLLDEELAKSEALKDKDLIKRLQTEIAQKERGLDLQTKSMSQAARTLLYTQKQREELEKQNIEREKTLKQVNTLSNAIGAGLQNTQLGKIKDQIVGFIQNPLTAVTFLVIELTKTFLSLDKGIGEFAKGMNVTYRDAAKLNNEFNNIANSSMDVAVTTKGIRDTMLAIGQAMGSNAILNAKDAVTFTKLREQAGLTNDELAEMEKLSLATGTSLEKNVENTLYAAKTTALNNGVLLNEKQIMQEVAKASAATKLSLANNPEALAKAAAQAKALGMNLEQVNSIADKMLDIESSISNELEAELLTGKNLNLEQARLYALNNDMEGLSREIAKNFGSAAEFSKMNRLQQEAAAKAVGMSREELAKTLTDQEALKGLSGAQAEDAKAALEAARARGMSEADIKKQGIDGLMKQQSIQDRFNQSIEKLKEIFVSLVAPLMPVLDIFAMILKPVGLIAGVIGKIVGSVTGLVGGLLESKGVLITIASIAAGLGVAMNYTAIQAGIMAAAEKTSTMWTERGLILTKGKAAADAVILGYKAAMGSMDARAALLGKQGLVRSIGEASMKVISSLSAIPVVGWALGLAAAAGVAALGYKFIQGNDIMSPGYGKRTLMGPEGAIALNDKDTVIAGTNLFDKKGDDISSTPGKPTEFKTENEIKLTSIKEKTSTKETSTNTNIDMSAVIAKLDALTAAVQSFGTKPVQVAVTMDGKKVAEGLGNHATQLGTSANVGTSKVA